MRREAGKQAVAKGMKVRTHSSAIVPTASRYAVHARVAISALRRRESGGLDFDGRYTSKYAFMVSELIQAAPPTIILAAPLANTKCTITPKDTACAHGSGSSHAHEM